MSTLSRPAHGVDGGRAGVARRRPDDRDALAPLAEHVVEQPADELEGDVLEGQRRARGTARAASRRGRSARAGTPPGGRTWRRRRRRSRRSVPMSTSPSTNGAMTAAAVVGVAPRRGAAAAAPATSSGTYRPPSTARPASSTSANPELGRRARGWRRTSRQPPIDPQEPPTRFTTSRSRRSRSVACTSASRASWVMNTSRASSPWPSCSMRADAHVVAWRTRR